jgi:hypothetical protein
MQAPPANLGPVTVPQSNPGNAMQALEKVKLAGKMIQEALPMIPMGSDAHNKLMKISTDLTKLVSESQDKVMQVQTLLQQLAAARQQNAQSMGPMAPPPNAGPAMAPPGAA